MFKVRLLKIVFIALVIKILKESE
ncbi:UNVERIFIED_CONTAM: hypothetical protein GTU68_014597 [Idotea baltica]|nr:hypothetical protein [Idotea baltica]